jgi:hypothetical protein
LLTVIAKLSRIGNCFRLNWKGNISSFDGHKGMRCNGTVQIIRAQVQKQSPKRSNSQT